MRTFCLDVLAKDFDQNLGVFVLAGIFERHFGCEPFPITDAHLVSLIF
jgi:hypothetical protein